MVGIKNHKYDRNATGQFANLFKSIKQHTKLPGHVLHLCDDDNKSKIRIAKYNTYALNFDLT